MKKQSAFTLIELLVVIAIIALLLSIIMPSLRMAKEHAKRLICATHLKSIGQAVAIYADQENSELPMNFYQQDPGPTGLQNRRTAANPVATYFLGSYDAAAETLGPAERFKSMMGKDANGNEMVTNLGYLMSAGLLDGDPEVVYCTSNRTDAFSYDVYGGDAAWPKGLGGTSYSIRISYSYLPQSKVKRHPASAMSLFSDAAYKMTDMNPNLSMVIDLLQGENMSHRIGGYAGVNILYGGGHVAFKKDEDNVIKDNGNLISMERSAEWRTVIRALE